MKQKISAIVPAYNEGKRIKKILDVLVKSELIDEVICIDDGSYDNTAEVIRTVSGISVITLKRNYGKSFAIARGIEKSTGEILLFVDSDTVGLTKEHITCLIEPLIQKKYSLTVGYRAGQIGMERIFFRPFGGERAYFKKDLLPLIPFFEDKGYALEIFLNNTFRHKKMKIIKLEGITNSYKQSKQPFFSALSLDMKEVKQIAGEILRQRNPIGYVYNTYKPFYLQREDR